MFEFIKTEAYNTAFSIIIGIGIVAIFTPGCRDNSCAVKKAPPVDEVVKTVYKIGDKCYRFKTNTIDCPIKGIIEPFEIELEKTGRERGSNI
jgi:hypothetical protein